MGYLKLFFVDQKTVKKKLTIASDFRPPNAYIIEA